MGHKVHKHYLKWPFCMGHTQIVVTPQKLHKSRINTGL